MEKVKTPLTVLIEKEENILRRYEALKFDDATIQMQKGFIGRLQEQLQTERDMIEKAFEDGALPDETFTPGEGWKRQPGSDYYNQVYGTNE